MLRRESIEWLLDALWRTSWQSAVIAVIVGLVIIACRPWLTPTWRLALWCLPLARMLVLIIPASPMSLFGLLDVACITNTTSSVFQNRSQVATAHDTATQSAWPVETVVVQTSVLQPLSPLTTEMGAGIRTANPSLIPKSSRLGTIIIFVWIAGISISAMRIIENRRQIAAIVESG